MRRIFTFLLVLIGAFASAQNTPRLTGVVQDAEGKPLAGVTVSLFKAADNSLVKVSVSDKTGGFEFLGLRPGNYQLSLTSVGFSRASRAIEVGGSDVQVPAFSLQALPKDLNNVTVTAKKPFVETKLDRTLVNVDASPTNAGSTALEVLEKSPGIMVNNDGAISLRGKQGVIVMVDGKPTFLSPTDLATMLRNMPASALDQIEIMTNPSAKYDASGNSGVINIKTKKGRANGFNGNFMIGATTGIYNLDGTLYIIPKSQNSFNFNYRRNKLNFFGNYNPNFFRGRNTMNFESKQIDAKDGLVKGLTDQETRFKFANFNQTLKLGVDWQVDKKNIVGVVASGFLFEGRPTPTTVANMRDLNGNLLSRLVTETRNKTRFRNFTGNLNWRHTFDSTGRELSADLDYVRYSNVGNMTLNTDIYDGSLNYSGSTFLRGHLPSEISIASFKSDYVRPFKGGRIEAGVKASIVRNDNEVEYENRFGSGPWRRDEIRSNHFIYEENINAAYVNANRQIGKWTLQAGLRVENLNANGNQVATKTTFTRDTTNFFPTAFVSYALNKKNTLTGSYGKRILRPNYQDMNPFIFFLDTLSFRQGNIYLRPQYTHNFELSHAFLGRFITTLSYNNTTDVIAQIIKPLDSSEGRIRYLTPDNVARLRNMAVSFTVPVPVAKWWNANLFANVFNNHYTGVYDTIDIDLSNTSFNINLTNSFTISKGFTAELSGFYRSGAVDQLTRIEPIYQISLGLQKQVLQGKGTLRLNVRDPFAWQKFEGTNKYGYVDMRFRNRPDIRQVTATFSYRFGKSNQPAPQRRRNGSSQEEQSRVGGAG